MKIFDISIIAYGKYPIPERTYHIQATADRTAASKALKEFWSEPVNKKRKRSMKSLRLVINY